LTHLLNVCICKIQKAITAFSAAISAVFEPDRIKIDESAVLFRRIAAWTGMRCRKIEIPAYSRGFEMRDGDAANALEAFACRGRCSMMSGNKTALSSILTCA
jgi:hypothetical protein